MSEAPPDLSIFPLSTEIDPSSPDLQELVLKQMFPFMTVDGLMPLPIEAVDDYFFSVVFSGIFFGVRVGSTAVVGILLFLISKNRRTPAFLLNQICLWLLFIQSALYLNYEVSYYSAPSTYFSGSYIKVTDNDVNASVASSVFQLLLVIAIQFSLIFQVRAVFPPFSLSRKIATFVMGLFSSWCIVFYFLFIVERCFSAKDGSRPLYGETRFAEVLPSLSQLSLGISIFVCCLVLVGKLLFAIRTRHILGLRQFGPLQILVIMGTQSMIAPLVIYIVNWFVHYGGNAASPTRYVTGLASIAPLIVVLSLPMSSLWAASKNTISIDPEFHYAARSSPNGDTCSSCQSTRRPGFGGGSRTSSAASAYETTSS